jgi:hypothetical protein
VVTSSVGFSSSSAGAAEGSTRIGFLGWLENRIHDRINCTSSCGGWLSQRGQVLRWENLRVGSLSLSLYVGVFNGPCKLCNPIGQNQRAIENSEFLIRKEISKVERTIVAYNHATESNWVSILVTKIEKRGVVAGGSKAIGPLSLELLRRKVVGVVRTIEKYFVGIVWGRRCQWHGCLFCCVGNCFVKEEADFVWLVARGLEMSIKMVDLDVNVIWISAERVEPVDHSHHQAKKDSGRVC